MAKITSILAAFVALVSLPSLSETHNLATEGYVDYAITNSAGVGYGSTTFSNAVLPLVTGTVEIPKNLGAFTNDVGYITKEDVPEIPEIPDPTKIISADGKAWQDAEGNIWKISSSKSLTHLEFENKAYYPSGKFGSSGNISHGEFFYQTKGATYGNPFIITNSTTVGFFHQTSQFGGDVYYGTYTPGDTTCTLDNRYPVTFVYSESVTTNLVGKYATEDFVTEKIDSAGGVDTNTVVSIVTNTIPKALSAFTNDTGYITADQVPRVDSTRIFTEDGTMYLDATGCVWRLEKTDALKYITVKGVNYYPSAGTYKFTNPDNTSYWVETNGTKMTYIESYGSWGGTWSGSFTFGNETVRLNEMTGAANVGEVATVVYGGSMITNFVGRYATEDFVSGQIPEIPADIVEGVSVDGTTYKTGKVDISDVATKAESAHNYSSRIYTYMTANTNAWLEGVDYLSSSGKPCTLKLKEIRDGVEQTVWDQRDLANKNLETVSGWIAETNAALQAEIAQVRTNMPTTAFSWYDSVSGQKMPTNDTTFISTPEVVFSGGYTWEKNVTSGGECWILVNNGMSTIYGSKGAESEQSFFAIKDYEGNSIFEVQKTASRMADAVPSSCRFDESIGDYGEFTVQFSSISDAAPTAYVSATLDAATRDFQLESSATCCATVTWTGHSGAWVCHIRPKTKMAQIFAYAKFEISGSVQVVSKALMSVEAGIACPNTATGVMGVIRPSYNGSTVTWTWSEK
jgi:hypothetical protein